MKVFHLLKAGFQKLHKPVPLMKNPKHLKLVLG